MRSAVFALRTSIDAKLAPCQRLRILVEKAGFEFVGAYGVIIDSGRIRRAHLGTSTLTA